MPESCIFVFEMDFDYLAIFFDDEDAGIDGFGFYGEGVAGVVVEGWGFC